jgi:predicted permease
MTARILRVLERGYRAIVRLAPAAEQRAWSRAALATFREVCMTGRDRGGAWLLLRTGLREWLDLLLVVITLRLRGGRRADRLDPDDSPSPALPPERGAVGVRVWRDLRLAFRSLLSGGTTTGIAILTLALGIGVNATIFSVLDSVLWRQAPFRDAHQLVELTNFHTERAFSFSGFSRSLLLEWRQQTDLFAGVEAYESVSFIWNNGQGADMVPGAMVTPRLFSMLGGGAARGRTFSIDEGRSGTARLAIVSDPFWRNRLHRDPDAVGRPIRLNGVAYQVIGVMPRTFRYPSGGEQIWVPYNLDVPPPEIMAPRSMNAIARMAPGVTVERMTADVRARGERLGRAAGGPAGMTAMTREIAQYIDDRTERSLWLLSGAVGFLFLIVCANVANLALSRSLTRARDLSTCAALGASQTDLVRTALIEQCLLATCGALGGLAVALAGIQAVVASLPESLGTETMNPIDLDGRTLMFLVVAAGVATVLFGLTPALVAGRTRAGAMIGQEGRSMTGSRRSRRFRAALAIVEVAVSVVLLIGAALMARSFIKLASKDPGFDTRHLISLRVGMPAVGYADVKVRERVALEIVGRFRTIGGIVDVTTGGLPGEPSLISYGAMEFEHRPGSPRETLMVPVHEVPAGYFAALRLPILAGHDFRADGLKDAVIVNERFASAYFPANDAVGRRFRVEGGPWRTIVAVVSNTASRGDEGGERYGFYSRMGEDAHAYHATMKESEIAEFRTFLIRADDPDAALPNVLAALHAYDPTLVVWQTALVDRILADAVARPRVVFLMMSVFAGLGLVLATAGLYGVLSCLVTQRRREIGVRLALGASPRQMRWLVLGNGLTLTAIGVAIGLAAALPLGQLMRTLLYEVNPSDPVAIATSAILLGATALFACWWPARDAMRVSPVELLRE